MTITAQIRVRRRRAHQGFGEATSVPDKYIELDPAHVLISVNTVFKELAGRYLSLDETSPGIVNFWKTLHEDAKATLVTVSERDILIEIDRLLMSRAKIVGSTSDDQVQEAVQRFVHAMQHAEGVLRVPDQATLTFVGTVRALENKIMLALAKRLFMRKLCVVMMYFMASLPWALFWVPIYLFVIFVKSPVRQLALQMLIFGTDSYTRSNDPAEVAWKTDGLLTSLLLFIIAHTHVRLQAFACICLLVHFALSSSYDGRAAAQEVNFTKHLRSFILWSSKLLLLTVSVFLGPSYLCWLFVCVLFYPRTLWYAVRTCVYVTRLPVRTVALLMWHFFSPRTRARLCVWYGSSFNRNAVTGAALVALGIVLYRTSSWPQNSCTIVHFSALFVMIHALPPEQLLTLLLYSMTLPVYLSNMPLDTIERELLEWGRDLCTEPITERNDNLDEANDLRYDIQEIEQLEGLQVHKHAHEDATTVDKDVHSPSSVNSHNIQAQTLHHATPQVDEIPLTASPNYADHVNNTSNDFNLEGVTSRLSRAVRISLSRSSSPRRHSPSFRTPSSPADHATSDSTYTMQKPLTSSIKVSSSRAKDASAVVDHTSRSVSSTSLCNYSLTQAHLDSENHNVPSLSVSSGLDATLRLLLEDTNAFATRASTLAATASTSTNNSDQPDCCASL